MNKKLNKL